MVMKAIFASYTTASQRLGLAFEDGRIHGALDGVPVQMWFGTHAVHVGALLPRPAPFDLSVATKTLVSKLGDLFGGHGAGIGDAKFDETFAVKSSNAPRVAELLGDEARRALLDIAAEGLHPAFDAHSVHLRRFSASAASDSVETIERDFREAARLARVLGDSFGRAR